MTAPATTTVPRRRATAAAGMRGGLVEFATAAA